jgi:hypothetical protein
VSTRVKINSSTFKVLKKNESVDIDTATEDQLAFNGMASVPYPGIILQGTSKTYDWAPAQASSPPYINGYYNPFVTYRRVKTFSFQTQTVAPDLLFMVRPLSDSSFATPHYSYLNEFGSVSPSSPAYDGGRDAYYYLLNSWAGTAVWASTTTDTLTLRLDYVQHSSGNLDWEFSFLVFQYTNVPKLYDENGSAVG